MPPIVRGRTHVRPLAAYRLAVFDLDSTLIDGECIDEIAVAAGRGAEVAVATRDAMLGQGVDFAASLRWRVMQLRGVHESVLDEVYRSRIRITDGAAEVVEAMRSAGLKLMIASGGFGFFARRVGRELGIDFLRCNELEIERGELTGRLLESATRPVCDAAGKRDAVLTACRRLGISPADVIATGDGANDVAMLRAAGLGVAYRAKPVLRDEADIIIDGALSDVLEAFPRPGAEALGCPPRPGRSDGRRDVPTDGTNPDGPQAA